MEPSHHNQDLYEEGAMPEGTSEQSSTHYPVELGHTPAARPVYLTEAGALVVGAEPRGEVDDQTLASGLFAAAELVDDATDNPLASLDPDELRAVLATLQRALALAPAGGSGPEGWSEGQVLQLRSSAVTVLLALVTASREVDEALLEDAFGRYCAALEAETHPVLRDSLIFNLYLVKNDLPEAMREQAETYMRELAPLSPPYEVWFADGQRTLNVSWTTGQGSEGFYRGTVTLLTERGFVAEGAEREGGPATYVKEFEDRKGERYTVRITVTINHDSIFADMDKPGVQIVGYDGHSDIGRNIPEALAKAPDGAGQKLIFYGLCAGKDNLHRVRERYPHCQLLTTFTSSYFRTSEVSGRKQMSASENFNVLMVLVEDICEGRPWTVINRDIRDKAVLYAYHHVMPGGTNYISPVHTLIRRRVLDTDHDGQADLLDRLVSFDLFAPEADTAREFAPVDRGVPAARLDGTRVHLAAMALDTATGYNQVAQHYRGGKIVGLGYFDPLLEERSPVRFTRQGHGDKAWEMAVSARFAHMSTECLRAVTHYLFIHAIAPWDERLYGVETKLMGLTFAAFSLLYDEARYGRDDAVWAGLLGLMNLPRTLPYDPIRALLWDEHHFYSGSLSHLRKWRKVISAEDLAALEREEVGLP